MLDKHAAVGRLIKAVTESQAVLAEFTADHDGKLSAFDALMRVQDIVDDSDFVTFLWELDPSLRPEMHEAA